MKANDSFPYAIHFKITLLINLYYPEAELSAYSHAILGFSEWLVMLPHFSVFLNEMETPGQSKCCYFVFVFVSVLVVGFALYIF